MGRVSFQRQNGDPQIRSRTVGRRSPGDFRLQASHLPCTDETISAAGGSRSF